MCVCVGVSCFFCAQVREQHPPPPLAVEREPIVEDPSCASDVYLLFRLSVPRGGSRNARRRKQGKNKKCGGVREEEEGGGGVDDC